MKPSDALRTVGSVKSCAVAPAGSTVVTVAPETPTAIFTVLPVTFGFTPACPAQLTP